MKNIFTLMLLSLLLPAGAQPVWLLTGTYTNRGAEGIYVHEFDPATGKTRPVSVVKGLRNPSFLVVSPDQEHVYAVAENEPEGAVYALKFDRRNGILTLLNEQPSGGAHPCYIDIDASGRWLTVANYTGGSVAVFPIGKDGKVGAHSDLIQHKGSSVDPERQTSPHPHSAMIVAGQAQVWVPDLGMDKIIPYELTPAGNLRATGAITQPAGSGPRHMAAHPNGKFAYVINELNGSVTVFQRGKSLTAIQTITTLPKDFTGKNWCADIHLSADGKFLYGSNRGHESLVIYAVDHTTGKLTFVDRTSVQGKWPRNFMIDLTDKFLLVANQETDNVVIFHRDVNTGKLSPTGHEIKISMPVCLRMVPRK